MPRIAREKSSSGTYHIMLRGANRQEVFHDEEDSMRFLETLYRYKEKSEIKVLGWCLMGNHVHLLLKEGKEEIAATMKRIGVSYAWYYNWKYKTTGHLFQDRFKSEKVEDEKYLLTVVRYIHQNPVKAGLVKLSDDWKWSSSGEYREKVHYPVGLLDEEFILDIFSEDKEKAIRQFIEFNETNNGDVCLEEKAGTRLTDEAARDEILRIITGYNIGEIKSLPKAQRDEILKKIKKIDGVTQRQASRILGISPNLIFKA